ncbi:MAG: fumarylacetoacetate hydrolase family protein [Pseudomonadota bacterium]
MSGNLTWPAPEVSNLSGETFAVRHVWCVGRNYAEHAREMGVDPEKSSPLFFAKPAQCLIQTTDVDYPQQTESLHHEVELAVLLSAGGRDVPAEEWGERIWGYATAVDLTRRDVQAASKAAGQPWELSKGFDQSAPLGPVTPAEEFAPESGTAIELRVNDEQRQAGALGQMIWSVGELLARLSAEVTLNAGDVVLTGTPAGVGPIERGDRVDASIQGLAPLLFTVR